MLNRLHSGLEPVCFLKKIMMYILKMNKIYVVEIKPQ